MESCLVSSLQKEQGSPKLQHWDIRDKKTWWTRKSYRPVDESQHDTCRQGKRSKKVKGA
ncbi:hypothetical protein KI387_036632, partial [Taxus chinensis]